MQNFPTISQNPFDSLYEVRYSTKRGRFWQRHIKEFTFSDDAYSFYENTICKYFLARIRNYCSQQDYLLMHNLTNNTNDYRRMCFEDIKNYIERNKSVKMVINCFVEDLEDNLLMWVQDVKPARNSRYTKSHTELMNDLNAFVRKCKSELVTN